MEDGADSPMAVRVEEHSRCVILTYFQGDINSMVDAHFTRALSKVCRAKSPVAVKTERKKILKTIKQEQNSSCQGSSVHSYSEAQVQPMAGRLLNLSPAADSPDAWHSFAAGRSAGGSEGSGVPSIAYSISPDGLSLTGQQYATSLLNLLHNDRGEMGPGVASGSKPEMLSGWTMPQFRDSIDPAVGFEPGRRVDTKKDLYWY